MALPARPMHIPAGLPIDQSVRPEILDVGKANVRNVNVRQNERGALEHRLGFSSLSPARLSGSRLSGRRVFAHGGVPTVIDGDVLDAYIETAGRGSTRDRVAPCAMREFGIPMPTAGSYLYDVECCAGYVAASCIPAVLGGIAQVSVLEASTGETVLPLTKFGSSNGAVFLGSFGGRYFIAIHYTIAGGSLTAYLLDTQALSSGWTPLGVSFGTTVTFPAVCSLTDRVAVAWGTASGTNRLAVSTFNASGLVQQTTVNTSSVSPSVVDISGSIAGVLWVAWDETINLRACGLDADALGTTFATAATLASVSTDIDAVGICEGTANTARAFAVDTATTPFKTRMVDVSIAGGVAVGSNANYLHYAFPASRPFFYAGRYYMAAYGAVNGVGISGNSQAMCAVVDWTRTTTYADGSSWVEPVANIEPGLVSTATRWCKFTPVRSGTFVYGLMVAKSGGSIVDVISGLASTSAVAVELDFNARFRWQPAAHAGMTFLGGALTQVYDGDRVAEVGFLLRPTKPVGTAGAAGLPSGTYRYVAIYEDLSATGDWVVSGISEASDPVVVASKQIAIATAPLTISRRLGRETTRVAFYRTDKSGEPPYYRVGVASNVNLGFTSVSYTDNTPDTALTVHAKLYAPSLPGAAGESQDRRGPRGLTYLDSYNGMLVGAQGSSLYYSGQEVYGEATWFSPAFEVPVSGGGGDITGLRSQDGTLFVFKADRIFAVAGEAPSDNGLQGGLGFPRLLASDVGCIEPDSIVVTALGVFFQSRRGIELLTRSQTVEWVGEPIQDLLATYPIVTSAVLDDRNSLVRFTLAETATTFGTVVGSGRTAVFDLTLRSWVSEDNIAGTISSQPAQSATLVHIGGAWRYSWLGTDGRVWIERDETDPAACLDGSLFVPASYELPPWKLGLQQEQRIYEMELLFEGRDAAGLIIDIAYDYGVYSEQKTWSESALTGKRQVSFRPKGKTTAVQLRVSDSTPLTPGTGRGLTFVGLSADIAPKQGPTRGTTRLNPGLRR